ncbi:MAG: VTT domain-containing protein [Candidatus Nanoarchaeia archaeon]|nr:VTT domain-containing protein [Candidatus Nanoarchaeia archaeon]
MKKIIYSIGFIIISILTYLKNISLKIFNIELFYYTSFFAIFFLTISIITKKNKNEKDVFEDKEKKKKFNLNKILLLILIFIIAIYYFDNSLFFKLINSNQLTLTTYNFINQNIINQTYIGAFISFGIGQIFFIYIPLEITFMFFLENLEPLLLIIITTIASYIGFSINYCLGKLLRKKISNNEKYKKFSLFINKFGGPLLFIAMFTPLPSQLLTFICGGTGYSYKKMIIYTTIATIIKFSLLYFYGYLIINYLENIMSSF